MTKLCKVCNHTGELTWRDGKYYCAMCGSEVSEAEPVVQIEQDTVVNNVSCPICKNQENNLFDGANYRCALCGTSFKRNLVEVAQTYSGQPAGNKIVNTLQVQELKKQKDKNIGLGVLFVFLFWPIALYFFYKAYQNSNELKALGY